MKIGRKKREEREEKEKEVQVDKCNSQPSLSKFSLRSVEMNQFRYGRKPTPERDREREREKREGREREREREGEKEEKKRGGSFSPRNVNFLPERPQSDLPPRKKVLSSPSKGGERERRILSGEARNVLKKKREGEKREGASLVREESREMKRGSGERERERERDR